MAQEPEKDQRPVLPWQAVVVYHHMPPAEDQKLVAAAEMISAETLVAPKEETVQLPDHRASHAQPWEWDSP